MQKVDRQRLMAEVGDIASETIQRRMLASEDNWNRVNAYVERMVRDKKREQE